jgi:predicted secreted protein
LQNIGRGIQFIVDFHFNLLLKLINSDRQNRKCGDAMFSDKRSGKIVLVAHCILNQNARVLGLAGKPGAIAEVVDFLVHNGVGIIQLPCPEFAFAGLLRQPKTREQYDNAVFRGLCRRIAFEVVNQIGEYARGGVKLLLVVGVEGSPSCSVKAPSGIFMEELRSALEKIGVLAPFCGIRLESLSEDIAEIGKHIK